MNTDDNVLIIDHQDGVQKFRMTKGGYSFHRNLLTVSIETENMDEGDDVFPSCAYLCLENAPVKDGEIAVGQTYSHTGGMSENEDGDDAMRCHGYFSFHAEDMYISIKIVQVTKLGIVIDLKAKHDDVNYYDKRAKKCPTSGRFLLKKTSKSKLWVPV